MRPRSSGRDGDLAVFGELAGIGKQVGDNLLQLSSVAVHIAHAVLVDIQRRRLLFCRSSGDRASQLAPEDLGLNTSRLTCILPVSIFDKSRMSLNERELLAREDDRRRS